MKSNSITEINKIKNLMNVTILNEQVAPVVTLMRRLVSQYGDDILRTIKQSEEVTDDILRKLKDPNAQITDDVAEKILESIDWNSLAKVVIKKIDVNNELPQKYVLKMLKSGSNIEQLQKAIKNKFTKDAPFNEFPEQLQNAIMESLNEEINKILKNKEAFNKLLLNLNLEDIVAKISKNDIDLLTKKGFNNFKEMGIDFLNKSQKLFREAQSLIKELSDTQNLKPTKEREELLKLLEEKIKKIQQLDTHLYTDIKNWIDFNLNVKIPQERITRENINEIFTKYNSVQPLLNNFWSRWGLQQAWESWITSNKMIKSALKNLKTKPITGSLDIVFGNSIKEGEKVWEGQRKIMNILFGTRRTLSEYRQLAKQIGVPATIISYGTEAVLLRAIGVSMLITPLTFIRDFLGALFNLGSSNIQLWNDFWNQWQAAPKEGSGVAWQFKRLLVMFFENIKRFMKQPGYLLKFGKDVHDIFNKVSKMTKEEFSDVRKEVINTISDGQQQLQAEVESLSQSTSTTEGGTLEDFKVTYGENSIDLGNGRFKRSDGVIFKWNGEYYERQ